MNEPASNEGPGRARPRLAAVLLAAGGGTRFRSSSERHGLAVSHKLLAPLRGATVFEHALANAREAAIGPVIVVTGAVELPRPAEASAVPPAVVWLRNPRWAEGQATSLAVAVDWATANGIDAIVCGLGDQPFIGPEAWSTVAHHPGDRLIVAASYGGKRRNPVRLGRAVWALLPRQGDEGARALLSARPDLVAEVACQGNPADIDTAEDLLIWS